MKKQKRYSYLLLELLIAFALVAIAGTLLVREPLLLVQSEINSLAKMELERLAEGSFADIKARLYQNEIPWSQIPAVKGGPYKEERNGKIKLSFGKIGQREFTESFVLKTLKEKNDANNREYRRIQVTIQFTPVKKKKGDKPFSFRHELFLMAQGASVTPPPT